MSARRVYNPPGALNGTSILRETEVEDMFMYYHIELASHELILAEGPSRNEVSAAA